jgi:hypothetical protein
MMAAAVGAIVAILAVAVDNAQHGVVRAALSRRAWTPENETRVCDVFMVSDAGYGGMAWQSLTSLASALRPCGRNRLRVTIVTPEHDLGRAQWVAGAWALLTGHETRVRRVRPKHAELLRDAYASSAELAPHTNYLSGVKLLFDDYVPTDAKRVLMLDADTLFALGAREGARLLACGMGVRYVAVAADRRMPTEAELVSTGSASITEEHLRTYRDAWFNSGVIVANVTWWRQHLSERVRESLAAREFEHVALYDQSLLNALIEQRYRRRLPATFNFTTQMDATGMCPPADTPEELRDTVVLCHWAGTRAKSA